MKTPVITLLALALCSPLWSAPPAGLQQRLDDLVKGAPGGVAAVWVDADGPVFLQSGTYSEGDPRPITADTAFEVGSVSKVFTSLLLAESERQGLVSRNDPVARYLLPAGDPDQAVLAKITLLSLSTHTSGLPRLPSNIGPNPDANPNPYADYDRAKLVAALRADGRGAPEGAPMAYSNFGVSLLGEALAQAWGQPFAEALRLHVLEPLGMRATSVGMTGSPPPPLLAPPHANGTAIPAWTFQACAPAGGVRSSARDMARLLSACLAKTPGPLSSALAATFVAQHSADDVGGHIGLGWLIDDDQEPVVIWHNGATAGSHAFIGFVPKTGVGLVLLCNSPLSLEGLGFSSLGAKAPHPRVQAVASAVDYVGRYPLSPAFAIDVTQSGTSLFIQATGQPQLALRPEQADRFAVVGVPAEISFERNPAGRVEALVLHQNGMDQRAPRHELPPPPAEIALDAATLRQYAGSYPLFPNFVITVSEEDGHLFAQATGQAKIPVYASAMDEFFYKLVNAQISFRRDASGKVRSLVLHQNGRDMPAPRSD